MNLVDSSGWLEYFGDGRNADYFSPAIKDTKKLVVSVINIYEVFKSILQQRDENSALKAIAIMHQGMVIDVDYSIALSSAIISHDLKLPMTDSIILATSKLMKAELWTQDSDFKDLDGIRYIKK